MPETLTMYGAAWCSDCRRTKAQLDSLGLDYSYVDIEEVNGAADEARGISGRTNIPVVVYPTAATTSSRRTPRSRRSCGSSRSSERCETADPVAEAGHDPATSRL